MTRTAIVPVQATIFMQDVAATTCLYMSPHEAGEAWGAMVYARPAVPDELIEEAAKAMQAADSPHSWDEIPEYERDEYRNMARAAARVFNGGKDE